ncbi:MAG: sensor domain-containing diguanylate cyclase [Pseudomonadota bacterium]
MALNATLNGAFLARMLDAFHHPLYVIDVRDYAIVYANAATRVHGDVQPGTTTCYALTHARDTPCDGRHPCPLQSVLETGRPAMTEHVHFDADRQPFPVEVHGEPMFDEAGELRYMMEYSLEISDRRDLEQKLRRAAMVIDQSAEGILITDPDQSILEVNPSFTAITGYPAAEVIGRTPRLLRSGEHDEAFYATLWDTLNRDGYWKGEIWNRYRDGRIVPQWESIFAIRNTEGDIANYVAIFHEISEQKRMEDELRHQALRDPLTGVWNRLGLYDFIEEARADCRRHGTPYALLMFDIDHFKAINDRHGHQAGDQVLCELARRVNRKLRENDHLGRWGGEEFMLLLRNTSTSDARRIAERLLGSIAETPFPQVGPVTVSIGVASGSAEEGIAQLEGRADEAMYQAKKEGRARVRLHHEDHPADPS